MRDFLTQLPRLHKRMISALFDVICIWLSLLFAIVFRMGDMAIFGQSLFSIPRILLIVPVVTIPIFVLMGLYKPVLRCINSVTLNSILKAVVLSVIALMVADKLFITQIDLPRSVPFLYGMALAFFMIAYRCVTHSWLLGTDMYSAIVGLFYTPSAVEVTGVRCLIYGDAKDVNDLAEVLDRTRDYRPVVIIDAEGGCRGAEVNGRPVFGLDDLESCVDKFRPDEILLAIPNASRSERKKVIGLLEYTGLPIKTMPSLDDVASGRMTLQEVRDIDISDILGRKEVRADPQLLDGCICKKIVMVTGAGGSIGSELCRQVLRLKPEKLILLDHAEYNLYAIEKEVRLANKKNGLSVEIITLLMSVTEQDRLFTAMMLYQVDTVYHAAAYKHVPLVEHNIGPGLTNNVWGTISSAQAAMSAGVANFVLISTDKAVRPTNIMGASKRLAELVLQALNLESDFSLYRTLSHKAVMPSKVPNKTCFTMVRFGNVLGSSGSVIPLFREQIKQGGPVTITHKDITRYFMSIPEAAQLVIQAGSMGEGGEVFVLDMGEPVKIESLARRMISLSGLTVKSDDNIKGDIEIEYSGLRPGEKLYEELLIGDNPQPTEHSRIFKANESCLQWTELRPVIQKIEYLLMYHKYEEVKDCLMECVSGFNPEEITVDWLNSINTHSGDSFVMPKIGAEAIFIEHISEF